MLEVTEYRRHIPWLYLTIAGGVIALLTALILTPRQVMSTAEFVLRGLLGIAPLVIPGIVLAAWVSASGAGARIADVFNGRIFYTTVVASLIGAVTPVCGVTVLPLMAGLLASGVPLAPIMAFWLSSPVTDPAMFATTAATLGLPFAVGKTIAAFALGMFGGLATIVVSDQAWTRQPLRNNGIADTLGRGACSGVESFDAAVWRTPDRRQQFWADVKATTRLILICLIPAFAAEYWLNAALQPEALSGYVGEDVWWAIPFAVLVGAPAYLDGYAALPLTRGLIDHGMSVGAAMAFLVSGGVVSIWGAMAIFPVIKFKPFLLYLGLAVTGSMMAGWVYGAVAPLLDAV